jgi:hypothetical protein
VLPFSKELLRRLLELVLFNQDSVRNPGANTSGVARICGCRRPLRNWEVFEIVDARGDEENSPLDVRKKMLTSN